MLREGDRSADDERRSGCPTSDEVAAFVERRLSRPGQAAIEAHIAACTPCRELVSALCRADSTIGGTRSGSVVTLIAEAPAHAGKPLASGTLDASLSAGAVIDRYTVLRRIGAGGMGVVYAAFDPELDRKVAIKILRAQGGNDSRRAELEARLITEARAMAQLAHPNVVAVFEIGRFCDQVFLVMELVEGQTLRTWLAERPRGWRKIVEVFTAAGQGLAAAHAAGLVHRDFKPANVLVGRDGRARVTDFGLVQDGAAANGRSAIAGTPYYMAPEQFRGDAADERTDQFSFCVALFAALYGARPFAGDSFDALAANVCAGRLSEPRAPRVPRRIRAALRRGLSVDPAERFSSLHDLLAELAEPSHRGRWVIGVGAAVGALVWLGMRSPAEVPDQRCTGAALAFATAWNAERRGAVEAAFTATHVPYAAVALHNVTDALDRYAAGWKQAHTEACRATRVLGEQTEATLDLRMLCLERGRELQERLLGPQHPRTAEALTIVGAVRNESGAPAAAEQALRRALAIREAVFGPQHRDVATTLMFLAESLDAQGRNDEALAISRRAVAIAEQAFGPEHPGTADVRVSLGNLLAHASRYAEAREQIGRGEAALTKVNGPTDYQVMMALVARGDLLLWQARWREALALYARAIPVFETMHSTGKEHLRAIVHREIALIELHQPARGLAALEQLAQQVELRPDLRIAAEATLACALWETGDRKRADELAVRARARIAGVGVYPHEIAQITGWLVGHRSCPRLAVPETTP